MLSVTGKSLVGYSNVDSGNLFFYAINPSTNQALETRFVQATPDEVVFACQFAKQAAPHFGIALSKRVILLNRIADLIEQHAAQLIHFFCLESGLPQTRAEVELKRSCVQFRSYAAALKSGYALQVVIDEADANRLPTPKPDLRKMNVPLGPVVIFGASNFPFAYSTLGGDVASALAAGCPVIVKAHPMHPHTSELSAQIIAMALKELQFEEGVFSHLLATDYHVGEQLVLADAVKAVGFTGSIAGGTALVKLAQGRKEPIPVFAEMGSVNPMVFTNAALEENHKQIAQLVADSIALNAGQFCTSPGLLFVIKSEYTDLFKQQLTKLLSEKEPQSMLHPGIFLNYEKRVLEQFSESEVLVDGTRRENHIQPSLAKVSATEFIANPPLQEEVFGSFALIVECENKTELLNALETIDGQLTGSLFLGSNESEQEVIQLLQSKVGRVILNGVPTGVEVSVAQNHGGPYPSSSRLETTAVGADAIKRFMRPVTFQNCPDDLLPEALKNSNPLCILRFVNGNYTY